MGLGEAARFVCASWDVTAKTWQGAIENKHETDAESSSTFSSSSVRLHEYPASRYDKVRETTYILSNQ